MSRDITEYIDDYVEDNYGHTNWGYSSTYSTSELNSDVGYDLELNNTIVIWHDAEEEE